MRTTLAMLCVLGTSLIGFSQDKNFDLSRYKFPDYKRHEMELNFNSSGRSNKESREVTSGAGLDSTSIQDYSNSNFNSNFSLIYQYNSLTRKQINHLTSDFSGRYDYSMENSNGVNSKEFSPSINWNINGFKRYYVKENKFFLEGLTDLRYYIGDYKTTHTNMSDDRSRFDRLFLSIGLGAGTGRIEKVSDLWQAYYILEKLNKQQSLERELQEKDIYEFAYLASKLKNKRFFDARLRKIADLQVLDSLLHNQGLVNNSDISYFTTLNDYWSYGNFQDRESGSELKVRSMPEYTRNYSKSNSDSSHVSTKTSIISHISFRSTKPLNLYWDHYFNASISYEAIIEKSGMYSENYSANPFSSNTNIGFGFFPDSRTSFSGYLGYTGQKFSMYTSPWNRPDFYRNTAYFRLTGNYYISPQLQITGNFNLAYSDKTYQAINEIQSFYNLGLRYAIF